MRKGIYYHFLESKEKESEHKQRIELRLEWEVVEKNNRYPQLLHLFPWEIKKVVTPHDLEYHFGIELNARQVKDHLLIHWDSETIQHLVNGKPIPLMMLDLDTQTQYQLFLRKWPNRERYMIQGYWFREFMGRRNLTEGMTIGMYWDSKSSVLRLSILGNS